MTPEERANKIADWLWEDAGIATNGLTLKITEAIRLAEDAARLQAFEEAEQVLNGMIPKLGAYQIGAVSISTIPEELAQVMIAAIRQHANGEGKL